MKRVIVIPVDSTGLLKEGEKRLVVKTDLQIALENFLKASGILFWIYIAILILYYLV